MLEKHRTVRLYGPLGARFGREFRLIVGSASEAVRALSVQIPGFRRYLLEARGKGLAFSVFLGKRNLSEDQLGDPPGEEEIRIAPILMGSKRGGLFQIIAGAVLLGAAAFATGGIGAALGAGGLWGAAGSLGASMVLGGVVQMLTPQPRGLSTRERPESQPSYMMNGIVNTQAQGSAVPVLYGEGFAGGIVLSAGIYAEDQQ